MLSRVCDLYKVLRGDLWVAMRWKMRGGGRVLLARKAVVLNNGVNIDVGY